MAKTPAKKAVAKKPVARPVAAKKPVARSVGSLLQLLKQINELAPKRSKASDGWVGDAKHAARHSDHNAEPDGTVDARDFTNDPNGGMDSQRLCDALVASRDPRISYIICNGKIIGGRKGPKPWVARKYTGSNSHHHHIHVSVLDEGQDDRTPWKIEAAFAKEGRRAGDDLTVRQVNSVMHLGSKGEFVKQLQDGLNKLGYGPIEEDGHFGESTDAAVKKFQKDNGLVADGWAGPRTMEELGKDLAKQKAAPKLEAATAVVEDAANGDKNYSNTEITAGITGLSGIAATAKLITDQISEAAQSATSMIASVGPWVLLGIVIVGGAGYIYYERRRKRLEATAVREKL